MGQEPWNQWSGMRIVESFGWERQFSPPGKYQSTTIYTIDDHTVSVATCLYGDCKRIIDELSSTKKPGLLFSAKDVEKPIKEYAQEHNVAIVLPSDFKQDKLLKIVQSLKDS